MKKRKARKLLNQAIAFINPFADEESSKHNALFLIAIGAILLIASFVYTNTFQSLMFGNTGHPSTFRQIAMGIGGLILIALGLKLLPPEQSISRSPAFQYIFSANAFIPSPPQYVLLQICLEFPKEENDPAKVAQAETAIKTAVTKTAATVPPTLMKHEIYPLLDREIKNAARSSAFSSLSASILSCEYSPKNPDQEKPKSESASNWV